MRTCLDVTVAQAAQMLKNNDKILLLCHQKPDGDTLGSGFALLYALLGLGKQVRIACTDGFPPRYAFLYPGFEEAAQPQFEPEFVVAVDIADTQLMGSGIIEYKDKVDLCIDHHPSNSRYAAHLLLDTLAAATVEIVDRVLTEMGIQLDKQIADCLYTGLATDTGCFRYSNVTAYTHRLAAKLLDAGVDNFAINKLMFETKTIARMELERLVMDTLEYGFDNRLAIIVISEEALVKTGVAADDLEGIAAIPRQIIGVEVAVTLHQKGPELYRASLRTNERVDASKVCARLGGGGHVRAAGCMLKGTLQQAKAQIYDALASEFDTAPPK